MICIHFPFRLISKSNEKIRGRYHGRYFLSRKFKDFEERIKRHIKVQYKGEILKGVVSVFISAKFKDKRHSDVPNLQKGLCDAMEGCIYLNDRQIKKISTEVMEGFKGESFYVEIKEIT